MTIQTMKSVDFRIPEVKVIVKCTNQELKENKLSELLELKKREEIE